MRLTLRTMLAYLDDILEPADAQEIAKKVGESEFATNLMHRIRDVTRRLRLAAPKLEGKGMGLDPNTVAEYLDNTLPGERVPDFEKVCLESDIHLAEVAAAHQILALVLGEPAEVKTGLREKMYEVGTSAQAVLTPPPTPRAPAETGVFAEAQARRKAVPAYLREPPRPRSGGWLVAAVLLLLVGGGVAVALNWDRMPWMQTRVAELPPSGETPPPATSATNSVLPTQRVTANTPSTPAGLTIPATAPPPLINPSAPSQVTPPPPTGGPATGAGSAPAPHAATPAAAGPAPTVPPSASPPSNVAAASVPPAPVPDVAPPDAMPSPTLTNPTPTPPPEKTAAAGVQPPMPPTPDTIVTAPPGTPTTPPPTPPAQPQGVGRVVSEREVLVRFNPDDGLWERLATGTTVYTNDRLLAFPTYRSSLALTAGINLQFRGASAIDFVPPDEAGVPGLRIFYGRLMLLSVGKAGAKIDVTLADRQGTITFGDGDSTVAIEVQHLHNDGANPEQEKALTIINMYVTRGQIQWTDATVSAPQMLAAPAQLALGFRPVEPAPADTSLPAWVTGDDRSPIEKRASLDVEEALTYDRPVSLGLKELAADRRAEVGALASRCLALIGEFDSFVTLLNDEKQRASWNDQIAALREVMAHSPESAAKIRETFLRMRGPEGEALYRMLWAYSIPQLKAGALVMLVEDLNHDDLDFRVVAFWNLTRLTNQTYFYRPEYTGAKRDQYVAKWRQQLEAGKLLPP